MTIIHGDCLEVMADMEANSIDAIVTDPPYGLGFMGKAWDALPPGEEWARECLRVLKPGGHLLAFGGTRTWHRLAVSIEDAGFDIRDSIAWMFGKGMPKGSATLKPAFEPIILARKPYKGSLAANREEHGTGAFNIDACRIAGDPVRSPFKSDGTVGSRSGMHEGYRRPWHEDPDAIAESNHRAQVSVQKAREMGRWPANVALDKHAAGELDHQTEGREGGASRLFYVAERDFDCCENGEHVQFMYSPKAPKKERPVVDGVAHPTVKPLALMRWLCRLVTPEGGTILDPFAGSGTTLEAATLEGFKAIGIEAEADYLPLIQARINRIA